MAKIWRNRIEDGAQKLAHCPKQYRAEVIALIQVDINNGAFTKDKLSALVFSGILTPNEYQEITGDVFTS